MSLKVAYEEFWKEFYGCFMAVHSVSTVFMTFTHCDYQMKLFKKKDEVETGTLGLAT